MYTRALLLHVVISNPWAAVPKMTLLGPLDAYWTLYVVLFILIFVELIFSSEETVLTCMLRSTPRVHKEVLNNNRCPENVKHESQETIQWCSPTML